MTLGERQEQFTQSVARLITFAQDNGFRCRIREVQRTVEQQKLYIEAGKSWTDNSKHLDSLACDIYFTKSGKLLLDKADLQILGDFWESISEGYRWGGNFQKSIDTPHFEAK